MKIQLSLVVMVVLLGSGTALAGSRTPGGYVNNNLVHADTMVSKIGGPDRKAVSAGIKPDFPLWEVSFQKTSAFDESAFDQYSIRLQQVLKEGAGEKARGAKHLKRKQRNNLKGQLLSFEAPGKWA